MQRIALKAYAKINLGLAVLGRRTDGYHELRTIYQSISLADEVEVRLSPRAGEVRLITSGFAVPAGSRNLAVRAAEAIRKESKLRRGILISLRKTIPPGSGLGGASSDAAAVLRAVQALSGQPLPFRRLLHLAAELGSDVPFFLIGGRAIGVGRGEEVYPLPDAPRRWVVILFPGEGMDTAEAYRLLRKPRLTGGRARPTIELFSACAMEAAMEAAAPPLENDFQPLLFRRIPELASAEKLLLRHGAGAVSLSGSGSALFGLFADRAKASAAARELRGLREHVWVARTLSRREFPAPLPAAPRAR